MPGNISRKRVAARRAIRRIKKITGRTRSAVAPLMAVNPQSNLQVAWRSSKLVFSKFMFLINFTINLSINVVILRSIDSFKFHYSVF